MLRNKNLIPLSHQHHRALALCVRIERAVQAGDVELEAWQREIQQIYEQEIGAHFAAEEQVLFPAAQKFSELRPLVSELLIEHATLQAFFNRASARTVTENDLREFAKALSDHIRKEERQLFEEMQQLMKPEDLATLGQALDKALESASESCILPNAATRLRPLPKS
ncbi:MAG: hypothetical protein DMG71_14105 [Acidobacteria bacterium]|nr:MAG: hypothetical protein DMG71_14105 [Acidobacteriota bacterium]